MIADPTLPLAPSCSRNQDPFQLQNQAQNASINGTSPFTKKMGLLARRLRAHMACAGANCLNPPDVPVPAPTPPPPPTPTPPPSPPSPTVQYKLNGACLGLGDGQDKKFTLVMGPCGISSSSWAEGVDTKGYPQIFNAGGDTCLNLFDDKCSAGQVVHGGPCQKDQPSKKRNGNHFRWDATANAIACLACKADGLCLDSSTAGKIGLTSCSNVKGWTRGVALASEH
jgi:hypothetical protein